MKQPVRKSVNIKIKKRKSPKIKTPEQLDGSGLETYFKENILDKLGVYYTQQFEAKSIGRFYDFYLPESQVLIEVDGSYWHSDPSIYKDNLTITQKRNKRVDKIKDTWALINGYVLIRIWESDIRKDPANVMLKLSERLHIQTEAVLLAESKKNGSFFMKKN
jgi:very-short-patch-repair endonuclease